MIRYLEPKRVDKMTGAWSRLVEVAGRQFYASVNPGKRVRLAYSNRYGYHWYATVVEKGKGRVWTGDCDKGASVSSMLEAALEHEFNVSAFGATRSFGTEVRMDSAAIHRHYWQRSLGKDAYAERAKVADAVLNREKREAWDRRHA